MICKYCDRNILLEPGHDCKPNCIECGEAISIRKIWVIAYRMQEEKIPLCERCYRNLMGLV